MSNRSTDWWKTLRVWDDLLHKQQRDPLCTRMALLTTATAAPGSIPSLLRDDVARDPAEALKQLVALAATAPSQAGRLGSNSASCTCAPSAAAMP